MSFHRPGADVATTGWERVGAASHADALNEVSASLAEFVRSADLGTAPPGLVTTITPTVPAGPTTTRIQAWGAEGRVRVVYLNDSNDEQGVTDWQDLDDTPTTYSLAATLTGAATRVRVEVEALSAASNYPMLPFTWG